MNANNWHEDLREARRNLSITQDELARRAGISLNTLRAYESGKRHPKRDQLQAILNGLRLDRPERNRILGAAGFATDGSEIGPWGFPDFMFTAEQAATYVDALPWPAFLVSEMGEMRKANAAATALWDVDLDAELLGPVERNLLSVASNPRFAERCINLNDALRVMAAIFKGHHRGAENLDEPSPYFNAVLQRFLAGDPRYVQPFLRAFEEAEPRTPKIRWEYEVVWDEPEIGRARFLCLVNPASEPDSLAFNDWIPLDAESWKVVDEVKRRRGRHR